MCFQNVLIWGGKSFLKCVYILFSEKCFVFCFEKRVSGRSHTWKLILITIIWKVFFSVLKVKRILQNFSKRRSYFLSSNPNNLYMFYNNFRQNHWFKGLHYMSSLIVVLKSYMTLMSCTSWLKPHTYVCKEALKCGHPWER